MQNRNSYQISAHEDDDFFKEAVLYTASTTGFTSELIEKDYFCSVLLSYLRRLKNSHLRTGIDISGMKHLGGW